MGGKLYYTYKHTSNIIKNNQVVFLYLEIYIPIYSFTYMCVYVYCIHIYVCECMHIHIQVYMHVYIMCVYIYSYICIYITHVYEKEAMDLTENKMCTWKVYREERERGNDIL